MPRAQWRLDRGRPSIQVVLTESPSGQAITRTLLADTGAGSRRGVFELILDEDDCLICNGTLDQPVAVSGAFVGLFLTHVLDVRIPALSFDRRIRVVGVPTVP